MRMHLIKTVAGSLWADQAPASHWPTQGGEGGGGCLCELYFILCFLPRVLLYTLLLYTLLLYTLQLYSMLLSRLLPLCYFILCFLIEPSTLIVHLHGGALNSGSVESTVLLAIGRACATLYFFREYYLQCDFILCFFWVSLLYRKPIDVLLYSVLREEYSPLYYLILS